MKKNLVKISKFLSLVLRHKPEDIGLYLDENGWADVVELLEKAVENGKNIDFQILEEVVLTNDKKRFTFNEDKSKIRASQGHSIDINLELRPVKPPDNLYHGTAVRFLELIKKSGLMKMNRQHVHLSKDKETAVKVGQRHGKPIVLIINSKKMYEDGFVFYLSKNGIWLTEEVPIEYIKEL